VGSLWSNPGQGVGERARSAGFEEGGVMSWKSVAKGGLVTASLIVLSLSGTVAPAASADIGASKEGAWMATMLQEAADHGYAVAGSSPASARFIPITQAAAYNLYHGAAEWSDTSSRVEQ
jgi:hypothetical protein